MMTGILTSIAILVVVLEFSTGQIYDWSPCSRTCGKGTRSRKCQSNVQGCSYEYEDCKVKDCPIVQCTTYKYDSVSECCRDEDFNKCGVLQLAPDEFRRRIIGGNLSEDGQWPWQVAVKKKPNKFICGAALLNERWILTAAHCFTDQMGIKDAKDGLAVAGITRLNERNPDEQTYEMEKFILHPNNTYWTHDLALVKVKIPIRYSAYVHPICLPDGDIVAEDTTCYVAGWGVANMRRSEEASIDLLHVGLRVLPLAVCKEAYDGQASSHAITNDVICAGILSGGKDACGGDSGGPLVCQRMNSCQWFMAGVVSFGYKICGLVGIPAVYTNVQKYQGWIETTMKENSIPVPGKWQPCSTTCGGGIQFRIENCSSSTCPKKYRGCNTQPCPTIAMCPKFHAFTYGETPSSCCKVSKKKCGVPEITSLPKLPVEPGHWPWMAAIFRTIHDQYQLRCSGVLISNSIVLSVDAALPLDEVWFWRGWKVLLGNTTLTKPDDTNQIFDIESIIRNEALDNSMLFWPFRETNICLVKLTRPATFSTYVMPICLPASRESVNQHTTCVVVGPPYDRKVYPPVSITNDIVKVLPMDICRNIYWAGGIRTDDRHHFCVGDFSGQSSEYKCAAYFTGSALVCQSRTSCGWYLAGLASFGLHTCDEAPDVFMNVLSNREWIRNRISYPPFSN